MKKKILHIIFIFVSVISYSQQDAQYTQYMYNTININPAYAGSREVLSIFALHRTQWVGVDGAPVTNAFSINAPVGDRLGLGLSVINDRIGPTDENAISADVSYTIPTSENYKLSFGLKATANLFNLDINKLNAQNSSDPTLQNLNNLFSPNFGVGIYLHSDKAYIGFSVPAILETKRYDDNSISVSRERLNLYLIGGYVFDLSPSIKFKPAFLAKQIQGAPLQTDISGNFLFNEKFVFGAAWRWSAAVSAMAGFQATPGIYIGYGYDFETTRLRRYNSGSHEIFLRFEIFKSTDKIVSPRFF